MAFNEVRRVKNQIM